MFANSKTLFAVVCFFRIMTMNMATNQVAEFKDNILDLNLYAYRAIEDAKQIYCQRIPLLFTDDCDQFIARMTNKTAIHLPQLILPQNMDINDEKTLNDLFVNMTATINEYLILVWREMNQEHKILCQPAAAIDIKCHYPHMCKDISNGDNAIFYCKLHSVHSFLYNFKLFLSFMIPDTMAPKTVMDDFTDLRQILPEIFRRWYTMIILDATLTQMVIFQKVMTPS